MIQPELSTRHGGYGKIESQYVKTHFPRVWLISLMLWLSVTAITIAEESRNWAIIAGVFAILATILAVFEVCIFYTDRKDRKNLEKAEQLHIAEYRANLFKLWIPDEWPIRANPSNLTTIKELEPGQTEILVGVIPRYTTTLGRFDMRFTSSEEGGNIDPEIIRIESISDRLMNKRFVIPGEIGDMAILNLWATRGEYTGGMDCYYSPPLPLDEERTIYFDVKFKVNGPWEGFLSFRGRGQNGEFVSPSNVHLTVKPQPIPGMEDSLNEGVE